MNGLDYKPILEQYKHEKDTDGKLACLCTMFELLVTNHLPHVEANQKLIKKWLFIMGGVVLLELILPDQISLTVLFTLLAKVFGA